jgi:Methyltransferase domain
LSFELTRVQEIPRELYGLGYISQCSVDFSPVAITNMREKCRDLDGLEWEIMDVRNLVFKDDSFDIAFDKVRVCKLKWQTANYV